MSSEAVRRERAISSLGNRTGAPLAEVRNLFAQEFSRLELGAKVRSYLSVLTASSVRKILRRKSAGGEVLEGDAVSSSSPDRAEPPAAARPTNSNGEAIREAARLAAWEDEGGTTARV